MDDGVELLLCVTLEYKMRRSQENSNRTVAILLDINKPVACHVGFMVPVQYIQITIAMSKLQ